MTPPSPPPLVWDAGTPEDRLSRKIAFLCRHIVWGQRARERREVAIYYGLRCVLIVLAVLTGAGLIQNQVNSTVLAATGWAFWAAMTVLGVAIATQVADLFGIERIATHARVVASMCDRFRTELGVILSEPSPTKRLNEFAQRVNVTILDPKLHEALPSETVKQSAAANEFVREMILLFDQNLTPARRGKSP